MRRGGERGLRRPWVPGRTHGRLPACALLLAAAFAELSACGEPLHPSKWQESPDEIPEGEGLLTGGDGEWIIYGSE